MADIIILAHFFQAPGESDNNRFVFIANLLCQQGHDVEVVTSNFSHRDKRYRIVDPQHLCLLPYRVTMLHEPHYRKNGELRRFYSHVVFGRNVLRYLKKRRPPEFIYSAVPSLNGPYLTGCYCHKHKIPFVIDVQDLWPEGFKMLFNPPFISDMLYAYPTKIANSIYCSADGVVAVSDTYLQRVKSVNHRPVPAKTVFLGTDLDFFDESARQYRIDKPEDEFWVVYLGMLGNSYDINLVSKALSILKSRKIDNIVFKVIGDGPLRETFQNYADLCGITTTFTGRLDYAHLTGYIINCDLAVNPIVKGAAQSMINKVGDYAAAALPVVNTLENPEYRGYVDKLEIGLNCNTSDANDLADKIELIYHDKQMRIRMGANNRRFAEQRFNRVTTYQDIVKMINSFL